MRFLLLASILVSLLACVAEDTQVQSATDLIDQDTLTQLAKEANSIVLPESPSEQVVISWPPIDDYNPFSTDPLLYEIWKNDKHIDTVETTRYVLTLDRDKEQVNCIRLRAVYGNRRSELSKPSCYSVSG